MTNKLFPAINLSTTEMVELAKLATHPTMQKYLSHLARTAIYDIIHAERRENESAESFLERLAVVRGGLVAVETLLAIENPAQAAS
jgi:hypothetical protein